MFVGDEGEGSSFNFPCLFMLDRVWINFVIFGMGANESYPYHSEFQIDFYDQSITVAFDIKDHSIILYLSYLGDMIVLNRMLCGVSGCQ